MTRRPNLLAAALLACVVVAPRHAVAALVLSADGNTVFDTSTGYTWLADADPAASDFNGTPGVNFSNIPTCATSYATGLGPQGCVTANGMMDYQTALTWVADLNAADYEGHSNWQLPITTPPPTTKASSGCSAEGALGGGYAFHCTDSALSNLFYNALDGTQRNDIIAPIKDTVGLFQNLQPNNYWTGTPKPPDAANPGAKNAYYTFSFDSGWQGSSVGVNDYANNNIGAAFLYVMTLFPGAPKGMTPDGTTNLQSFAGGTLVYDPVANVTWLADANPGADLGLLPLCTGSTYDGCVNSAGAMTWTTANDLLALLNTSPTWDQYLPEGVQWQLPGTGNSSGCNWTCNNDATDQLAYLFYNRFDLSAGSSVAPDLTDAVGPFENLQPYFYWTCSASGAADGSCSPSLDPLPADQANTFTFDSGFQSTDDTGSSTSDVSRNALFVEAYYISVPEPQSGALLLTFLILLAVARAPRARRTCAVDDG